MSAEIHERAVMTHDSTGHPHNYVRGLSDVTYILAALFFILSLSGLSKHETATRGNVRRGHTTRSSAQSTTTLRRLTRPLCALCAM